MNEELHQLPVIEASHRNEIRGSLELVSANEDPLFRELAVHRTAAMLAEAKSLAAGEIVFSNTETCGAAYEKLLVSLNFSTYFSVAWVRTKDYWRDQAGRQSIRLNYELLDRGLQIERILILPENLWSANSPGPSDSVKIWIEEQHYRGIRLSLIRQSELFRESDLIRDFGIYGNRASGEQELDGKARTLRFVLSFSQAAVGRARERWEKLSVFAIPCSQVLDLN